MTLRIHRSERSDALVRGLGLLLADVPDDPFTREVVAVPSRGVERWITQTLSVSLGTDGGDGICAGVDFSSPAQLVADALSVVAGVAPRDDPWSDNRIVWALLDVVDRCAREPWCATLGRHLGLLDGQVDSGRRVATAQKLAGLYSSYAAQRPAMLRAWAVGGDTDGSERPLDADLRWQAELWRRLRDEVGSPSPAERLELACELLATEPGRLDLPDRLSVFGPTRLTTEQLLVLGALAQGRDVHLWLPHPSHGLWDRITGLSVGGFAGLAGPGSAGRAGPMLRGDDPTADVARHPLLRSCARDAREMQLRLTDRSMLAAAVSDQHLPVAAQTDTLLARLQDDLRGDRVPVPAVSGTAAPDRSVQVHACHGRQRQVEVLRELVLGMLEDDPDLELRDVVVLCPDIETYAPLVSAAFGDLPVEDADADADAGAGLGAGTGAGTGAGPGRVHPGHRLRVRLADRSLRQTNPVLTVVARLLELADARVTASELLDLAAMPPVRARFGLDDDALELVGDWVRRSGVRWGLDAEARAPQHLSGIRQNTWQAGLDRVLVGVAMDEEGLRTVGLALPLDDVESNDVDLAGRFAELVDRVSAAVGSLRGEQTLTAWVQALVAAVVGLTDVPPGDDWQLSEARRQLTDALVSGGPRAAGVRLGLADVRALLASRLQGRPTRANFRTGHLTMCTMVPMRSVPHRVVCLLGLDDGVFPRQTHPDGDDVLARSPRVGERDARAEDRQLFLDALLAARERLVLLFTGADERTGAHRPPAVPLGELLDVLATMTGSGRDDLVVRHPLQPFDARNFAPGALGEPRVFSFDRASYDGARALGAPRVPAGPFLSRAVAPAAVAADGVVELADLVSFLEHPVRGFLRQRLGLTSVDEGQEADDALPVELDGLEAWRVGDRLLRAGLGTARADAVRAERLRGELPPGALGDAVVAPVAHRVQVLVEKTAGLRSGAAASLDVTVDLPGGVRVAGTVPGVHGDRIVRVEYSSLSARHRIRSWVQLLALAAGRPGPDWCAATVGRRRDDPVMAALTAPGADEAGALLSRLVELRRDGFTRPLPLAAKTSCAYAEHRRASSPAASVRRAEGEWSRVLGDGRRIGDVDDAWHDRVWRDRTGGRVRLAALLSDRVVAGRAYDDEPHLFGQLARQVFTPMLDHEQLVG